MRADRLLSALLLLQAQGRLSTRQIAERLSTSPRTAHRDLESLCQAGIPLVAIRGSQGGWELQKGWRTKVPGLDEAELRALVMAQPGALGDPRLSAAAERAFGKLMAALPGPMQDQAAALRQRIHIDPEGWWPAAEDLTALPVVQEAVMSSRRLSFVYTRPGREAYTRVADPLGLVCKQTVWYLAARTDAGMRTYRVSRMSGAVLLSAGFERPARFDLARYWSSVTASLQEQRPHYVATVALTDGAARSLERWCRVERCKGGPVEGFQQQPGWGCYSVQFENEGQARFAVLGYGREARALAPAGLREYVLETVQGVLEAGTEGQA